MTLNRLKVISGLLFLNVAAFNAMAEVKVMLFLGGDSPTKHAELFDEPRIHGAQVIYTWRELEPEKGKYDFKRITHDLSFLKKKGKVLYLQLQDKSFNEAVKNVPNYILTNAKYHGGVARQVDFPGEGEPQTTGWVAKQWVPAVKYRFQRLIRKLASQFDGEIAGVNLSETAIDLLDEKEKNDFSCDRYFYSVIDNIAITKKSFKHSEVSQYVNYFPCEWANDKQYMSRLFDYAIKHRITLGNPDTAPWRKGQMDNSYPFFHRYQYLGLRAVIAIQEPDYTYIDESTGSPFTIAALYQFASEYLGAKTLFWTIKEPQYHQQFYPFLSNLSVN